MNSNKSKKMKILKFGGTSLKSANRIKKAVNILLKSEKYDRVAMVVSAFGSTTDELESVGREAAKGSLKYKKILQGLKKRHLKAANELLQGAGRDRALEDIESKFAELGDILHGVHLVKECSQKVLDTIMSFGELLSAFMVAEFVKQKNGSAEFLDARKIIRTDDNFGNAHVDIKKSYQNIKRHFKRHLSTQIVTGFLGSTINGETTTLGRGGSDYTATLLGGALGASVVEIWTDVDGVMTADPSKVPGAKLVDKLRYEEAAELSYFGATIIYPPTIRPALIAKIPIQIKNTLNPASPGTTINTVSTKKKEHVITGITSIEHVGLIQIKGAGMSGFTGVAGRFFHALAKEKINIIMISQASSEYSICIAVEGSRLEQAKKAAEEEFEQELKYGVIEMIEIEPHKSIIAVVGENMRHTPGVAGKIFQALGDKKVNVSAIAQGSSELNISIVVDAKKEKLALNSIHDFFFANN